MHVRNQQKLSTQKKIKLLRKLGNAFNRYNKRHLTEMFLIARKFAKKNTIFR